MMMFDLGYSLVLGIVIGFATSLSLRNSAIKAVELPSHRVASVCLVGHCTRLLVMAIPAVFLWLEVPFSLWLYVAGLMGVKLWFIWRVAVLAKGGQTISEGGKRVDSD